MKPDPLDVHDYFGPSSPTTALVRMQLALAQLPLDLGEHGRLLQRWSEAVAYSPEAEMTYALHMTLDGSRAVLRATGDSAVLSRRLVELLPALGFTQGSLERLSRLGYELDPPRLGCWLELTATGADAGWTMPAEAPLRLLRAHLPPSGDEQRLVDWADRHGIGAVRCVGHSSGRGEAIVQLGMALPGGAADEQLATGLDAFAELDLPAPPAALRSLLEDAYFEPDLRLSVWLGAGGFAGVGLLLPRPRLDTVLRLASADGSQDERIAAVQGVLNVEDPAWLAYRLTARGLAAELHYRL